MKQSQLCVLISTIWGAGSTSAVHVITAVLFGFLALAYVHIERDKQ